MRAVRPEARGETPAPRRERRVFRHGLLTLLLTPLWLAPAAQAELYYLIVGGLGGEPAYSNRFLAQTETLADAAARSLGGEARVTLLNGEDATREALTEALRGLAETVTPADTLAVFLVGHGTYDGIAYKYNLPGRDLDGGELGELLGAVPAGRQLVVNATSASGAVLESWAREGRTLITATRSGGERNATRFAEHWTAALSSERADTDRNGVITAREAFDYTERMVAESYENEGTLATEHPQLAGEPAESFTAARLAARVAFTERMERLFAELDDLEGQIQALRTRRNEMDNDVYLNELQALLLELALVQQQIDDARAEE